MRRLLRVLVLFLSVSLLGLAVRVAQRGPVAVEPGMHAFEVDIDQDMPMQDPEPIFLGGLKSDMMSGIGGLIGNKGTQIGSGGLGARGSGLDAAKRRFDTDTDEP